MCKAIIKAKGSYFKESGHWNYEIAHTGLSSKQKDVCFVKRQLNCEEFLAFLMYFILSVMLCHDTAYSTISQL